MYGRHGAALQAVRLVRYIIFVRSAQPLCSPSSTLHYLRPQCTAAM